MDMERPQWAVILHADGWVRVTAEAAEPDMLPLDPVYKVLKNRT